MGFFQFHRTIKVRIIESFLSTAIGSMIFPFMAIYLAEYFSMKTTGLLMLLNVLIGIVMNLFGGYFSDSFGRKKLIVFAEFFRFIAFITMTLCNSPWLFSPLITVGMLIIHTICSALTGPANQAMLIDISKTHERKLMYTIMYWANNLSIAIGGILGGLLFKSHLFGLFLALSISSLIVLLLITFFIDESYVPANTKRRRAVEHVVHMFSSYLNVFRDKNFYFLHPI
ncbi:MFS transporter [Robertmurraya sp. Marseille-Q9965]